jgi:hypothetical protein
VIDANGRCTQPYDHGATLTDGWMDHRLSGLVQSVSFPLPQMIPKYLRAHVPGAAGNNVKRRIVLRSAGLGLVSMTNIYVCKYLILCVPLTAMLNSNMRTTLHFENVGMNDAFEYRGRCFINSFTGARKAFWFEVLILLTLWSLPAYPISLSCSFVIEASPELARFTRFLSLWPRWIKCHLGCTLSRTLHLHLYVWTTELRKRVESAVWAIYTESRCISIPVVKDCVSC